MVSYSTQSKSKEYRTKNGRIFRQKFYHSHVNEWPINIEYFGNFALSENFFASLAVTSVLEPII